MLSSTVPAWEIITRTTVVYLFILVGLRLMGKREMGQITILDLVAILLIANAVQNAMVGPDVSLAGGVLAAGVLLALNRTLGAIRLRGGFWGRLLEGTHCPAGFSGCPHPEAVSSAAQTLKRR